MGSLAAAQKQVTAPFLDANCKVTRGWFGPNLQEYYMIHILHVEKKDTELFITWTSPDRWDAITSRIGFNSLEIVPYMEGIPEPEQVLILAAFRERDIRIVMYL